MLKDLSGVNIVADDILVYGNNIQEHNIRLEALLQRARKVYLKLNPKISQIWKTEVPYVGHLLTQERLKANLRQSSSYTRHGSTFR